MKTFKSFLLDKIDEVAKPRAKGEKDFVDAHKVEVTDPQDQKNNSAKIVTKDRSGKRPADKTKIDETAAATTIGGMKAGEGKISQGSSNVKRPDSGSGSAIATVGGVKWGGDKGVIKQGSSDEKTPEGGTPSKEKEGKIKQGSSDEKTSDTGSGDAIKTIGGHRNRESVPMNQGSSKVKIPEETDLTKKQTKMAHLIGKHFAKKKVGDSDKGGPYAVATAMVKDKPEAAQKAYKTIQAKTKNEDYRKSLISLYDDLSEENKEIFMNKLENDFDNLVEFALSIEE